MSNLIIINQHDMANKIRQQGVYEKILILLMKCSKFVVSYGPSSISINLGDFIQICIFNFFFPVT